MTIAKQIADKLNGQAWAAFTLYGGYASGYDGTTYRFPTGVQELEKRNDKGRVIHARYRYADNSVLTYRYSEARGYSLECK
jgi:hypothetical protein